MATDENTVDKFRHTTGKLRDVFGPADQSAEETSHTPHSEESDQRSREQLSQLEERTDSDGHHYAVVKDEPGQAP